MKLGIFSYWGVVESNVGLNTSLEEVSPLSRPRGVKGDSARGDFEHE